MGNGRRGAAGPAFCSPLAPLQFHLPINCRVFPKMTSAGMDHALSGASNKCPSFQRSRVSHIHRRNNVKAHHQARLALKIKTTSLDIRCLLGSGTRQCLDKGFLAVSGHLQRPDAYGLVTSVYDRVDRCAGRAHSSGATQTDIRVRHDPSVHHMTATDRKTTWTCRKQCACPPTCTASPPEG
jgi:hypothetical protein